MKELSISELKIVSGGKGNLSPGQSTGLAVGTTAATSGSSITPGTILGGITNVAIVTAGRGSPASVTLGAAADNFIRRGVDYAYSSPLMVHEIDYGFDGNKLPKYGDKTGNDYGDGTGY